MLTNRLCKACEEGNLEEVNWLLESGASPNFSASGSSHWYPLHFAAANGHVDIVKTLLKNHAAVDPHESICAWTPLMVSSLHISKSVEHMDVFVELLVAGANVEIQDARNNTIVHILSSLGRVSVLRKLFDAFPNLDALGPGFGYLTPLHYATEAGHLDTVKFFLEKGADVRCPDACGWTPLHWACRRGQKDVIDLLLSHGASLEDKDFRSLTPLDTAALFGHVSLAKLLDAQYSRTKRVLGDGECLPSSNGHIESPCIDCSIKAENDTDNTAPATKKLLNVNTVNGQSSRGRCLLLMFFGSLLCLLSSVDYLYRANLFAVSLNLSVLPDFDSSAKGNAIAVFSGLSVLAPALAWGVYCWRHLLAFGKWSADFTVAAIGLTDDEHCISALRAWACKKRRQIMVSETVNGDAQRNGTLKGLCSFLHFISSILHLPIKIAVALSVGSCAAFALWVCGVLGVFVFKAFLIPTSALLQFLDILTFASAVRTAADIRKDKPNRDNALKAAGENEGAISSLEIHGDGLGRTEHLGGSSLVYDWFHSRCSASLEPIGEESPQFCGASSSSVQNCNQMNVVELSKVSISDKQVKPLKSLNQAFTVSSNFKTATFSGSVPCSIHPCSFCTVNYKCRRAAVSYRLRCILPRCFKRYSITSYPMHEVASESGVDVPVATLGQLMAAEPPDDPTTWKFHGSSGGLLAEAASRGSITDSRSTVQKMEGSCDANNNGSTLGVRGSQHTRSTENHEASQDHYGHPPGGIFQFAYKTSVSSNSQYNEINGSSVPVTSKWLASQNDVPDQLSESDSVPLNPYGWLKRQGWEHSMHQKYTNSKISNLSRRTRLSRPGIPGVFAIKSLAKRRVTTDNPSELQGLKSRTGFDLSTSFSGKVRLLFNRKAGSALVGKFCDGTWTSKNHWRRLRVLRRSRCRIRPQSDEGDVEKFLNRRQLLVFDWFERLVAHRYAQHEALIRNCVHSPTSSSSRGERTLPGKGDSASGKRGDQPRRSLETMQPGDLRETFSGQKSCSEENKRTPVLWCPRQSNQEHASSEVVEGALLGCLKAEDVFELRKPESACERYLSSYELRKLLGSKECECPQSDVSPVFASISSSPDYDHLQHGNLCSINTSFPQSCSPSWKMHFRFKDMVEMPEMRQAFFSLWCREFERLLLYQERCFGTCPLWLGKSLEGDSLSDFSSANMSSVITKSLRYMGKGESRDADAQADYNVGQKVLWLLPEDTGMRREHKLMAPFTSNATWCPKCSGDIPGGICVCDGVPEPPMSCAFACNSDQEMRTKLTSFHRRRGPKCIADHEQQCLPHILRTAVPVTSVVTHGDSPVSTVSGEPSLAEGTDVRNIECVSVQNVCYSLVLFVIAAEFLLGALPLLITVLLGMSLPMEPPTGVNESQGGQGVAETEVWDACHDGVERATFAFFGYASGLRSPMLTLCVLKMVRTWSFAFLIPMWTIYACIFFICRIVVPRTHLWKSVGNRMS